MHAGMLAAMLVSALLLVAACGDYDGGDGRLS